MRMCARPSGSPSWAAPSQCHPRSAFALSGRGEVRLLPTLVYPRRGPLCGFVLPRRGGLRQLAPAQVWPAGFPRRGVEVLRATMDLTGQPSLEQEVPENVWMSVSAGYPRTSAEALVRATMYLTGQPSSEREPPENVWMSVSLSARSQRVGRPTWIGMAGADAIVLGVGSTSMAMYGWAPTLPFNPAAGPGNPSAGCRSGRRDGAVSGRSVACSVRMRCSGVLRRRG